MLQVTENKRLLKHNLFPRTVCPGWLEKVLPTITMTNITEFQRRQGPARAVEDSIWRRQTG